MDWQNKFFSIVRETEENLAKAKHKLASKSLDLSNSVRGRHCMPQHAVSTNFSQSLAASSSLWRHQHPAASLSYSNQADQLNMSAASGIQVLHMQEQIDAQNRTIDQLQKLVRSLDRERDFYKEKISNLQGEVDTLAEKMGRQLSLTGTSGSERQISSIKQEVIQEIDKVKTMLFNQSRASRVGASHMSPRLDDELWNVKESLTESLEHIRRELRLMNKRIDRMESGISSDTGTKLATLSQSCSSGILPRPHREPLTSYTSAIDSGLDVNQLRSTINLLNTKLDSLESKIDAKTQSKPNLYPHLHTNIPVSSYAGPLLQPSNEVDGVDDLSSLSGLSDLSDLSDDIENDALDDEIDAIIKRSSARDIELKSNSSAVKSSIYKTGCKKKGRVEFDLSDLDLSDVEATEVDSDSLDL